MAVGANIQLTFLLTLVILCTLTKAQNGACPTNWQLNGGYCFYNPNNSPDTWTSSEAYCKSLFSTAHLPYFIDTNAWNSFLAVRSTISIDNVEVWIDCKKSGSSYVWGYSGSAIGNWTQANGDVWPLNGNTYCTSDKNPSYTWNTYSNGNKNYVCMMNNLTTIDPSTITVYQSATTVAAGTSVKFWVSNFVGSNPYTIYVWNFGDGTTLNTTTNSATHSYFNASTYTFSLTVDNAVGTLSGLSSINNTIVTVYTTCKLGTCSSAGIVKTGTATTFTVVLTQGAYCNVSLNPGDNSSVNVLGVNSFEAAYCDPSNAACGSVANQWTITFSYTYQWAGVYTAIVKAYNPVTSVISTSCPATVQDPISGAAITSPASYQYFAYGVNIVVKFSVDLGTLTAASFLATIDSSTSTVYWSSTTRTGNVTITPNSMSDVGPKFFTLQISNAVTSPPIYLTYNFTVEYNFTSFSYSPSPAYFNTSTATTIKLSWLNATVVDCTVDYQGIAPTYTGAGLNKIIANSNDSVTPTAAVTYATIGLYKIIVYCVNDIAKFNYTIPVVVQNPICCVRLDVDYVQMLTAASGSSAVADLSLIWTDPSQPWPTNASYDYNFNDGAGSKFTNYNYSDPNVTISHTYTVSNCYVVNVTVYNLVTRVTLTQQVCIIVQFGTVSFNMTKLNPLTGHEPNSYYLQTNEVARFDVYLTKGTLFNMTIDYNDSTIYNTFVSNGSLNFHIFHSFANPGNYSVSLSVMHQFENAIMLPLPVPATPPYVVVEAPVACFMFNIAEGNNPVITYPNRNTGVVIHVNVSMNSSCGAATQQSLKYTIVWNDTNVGTGTVPSGVDFFFINHTYSAANIYTIQYTIWNDVSILNSSAVVHVFDEVTNVTVTATWVNSTVGLTPLIGFHVNSSIGYFPFGYPITFYASMIWGNLESYVWTINDVAQPENGTQMIRNFSAVGPYVVEVKIKNTPSAGNFSFTAIVERPTIQVNLTDNSPWPLFLYHTFSVAIQSVGTDCCYSFSMDDLVVRPPSKADCENVFFGDQAMCTEFFPSTFSVKKSAVQCPSFTSLHYSDLTGPLIQGNDNDTVFGTMNSVAFINFTHWFEHKGAHNVTLTVVNHVSTFVIPYRSVVTNGWCQFPIVQVHNLNTCPKLESCKCYFNPDTQCYTKSDLLNGDRLAYTKDQIIIDSQVTINCSSSPNIWFRWSLHQFNNTNSNATYDVTYLLKGLLYATFTSRTLVIPPNFLPAGRYLFNLTVSPAEEIDMDRSDTTILVVEVPNLVAQFANNASGVYVPSAQQVLFDAWTYSYDSGGDVKNKTGMNFTFYCRRLCEIMPVAQGPHHTYNFPGGSLTSACTAADGNSNGCFGSEMALTGSSSNWAVNSGNITLNTAAMKPKIWYTLMVVVTKDTRVSYAEIFFYVSPNAVPSVTLNCITNCQQSYAKLPLNGGGSSGRWYNRVNPTSRFSIEAIIDGFDLSETYFYQWDLIQRPNNFMQNTSFSMSSLTLIPDSEWLHNVSTGRAIRTISFQANWYGNDTSLEPGFYVRLSFWVHSNVSGPFGQYFYEIFVNAPPNSGVSTGIGTCSVPSPGVSLSSSFGIECKNFHDSNNGELYYFVKQPDTTHSDVWLYIAAVKGSMIGFDNKVYVSAVPGSENCTTPYETEFVVRVIDSSGSFVEVNASGTVEPFDYNSTLRTNSVYSILNYTTQCSMCQYENYYVTLIKTQTCVQVAAVVRTFSTMLNENPSSGCIPQPVVPVMCDNTTAATENCTYGEELPVATTTPARPNLDPYVASLINGTLGPTYQNLTECQLDLHLRIYLREILLQDLSELVLPYFSNFVVVLSAMYPATVIPQENTIQIMQYVQAIIEGGVKHLDGVDPQMGVVLEADLREEICTLVTAIVANMEHTTNYYGAIWRTTLLQYYPSFTMDGLQQDISNLADLINNNVSVSYTSFKFSNNSMWTLNEVNGTSMDEATETMLNITRFNITLISVVLSNIYQLKLNVTQYVQARKAMGEAPSVLQTPSITSVYHKTSVKNMTGFPVHGVGECKFQAGNSSQMFPNPSDEYVTGSVECAAKNAYTTDKTSINLTGTVSVAFHNNQGGVNVSNLTKPMDVFVPNTIDHSLLTPLWNTTQSFSQPMIVYSFSLSEYSGLSFLLYQGWIQNIAEHNLTNENFTNTATTGTTKSLSKQQTTAKPTNESEDAISYVPGNEAKFVIFVKFYSMFDIDNKFDYYCIIPQWDDMNTTVEANDGDPRTCTVSWSQALAVAVAAQQTSTVAPTDKMAVTFQPTKINVYVSVQSLPNGHTIKDFQNTTKIPTYNNNLFVPVNYTLFAFASRCPYYDSVRRIWSMDGTDIGPKTTINVTHCRTTHLTAFSSGFSIPTNSLSLQDSAFKHLAENPIAFIFCMCLFCLYLILLVWCRRKDKEDLKKAGIAPLPDNDPRDRYLYELVFYTGSRPNAGTTAQVYFQLSTEKTESDVRLAKDIRRKAFNRNGIDTFIMAVPEPLGKMTHLRIWHDNSGSHPAWYFSRLQIMDVQTGEQFFFVVDNWLAVEEGDGQVERIVPVAGKKDLVDFQQLFWQKSQKNLFDGHIWFSVFRRPPRSNFTRIQRLTCCLSLVYCTMVANILFYNVKKPASDDIILSIGPIIVSWTSMKIGIVSALIVAPVNMLLVFLFRYAKPKPIKSPMQEYYEKQKQLERAEQEERKKQLKLENQKKQSVPPGTDQAEPNQVQDASDVNDPERSVDKENEEPVKDVKEEPSSECHESKNSATQNEPPKVVHIDTRAKKKKFWLPHWVIYIGYVLALVTVGTGFFLIMQYCFLFGKAKALDWVIAMFVSLIQSIIFIQPFKIIAMAIVYSVLCKKPEKDEYEPSEIELREDEVYVHEDVLTEEDRKNKSNRMAILQKLKRTRAALPPDLQALQNAREIRLQEIAMWGLLREIGFYAVFLYTMMMVAYGERDGITFNMIRNGVNIFVRGSAYGNNSIVTQFTSIKKHGDFFDWAERALLPGLFPTSTYNKQPLPSDQRYIYDGQGYLAGTVRLRQLRVKPNTCKVASIMQHVIHHCRASYSISNDDWGKYKKNWVQLDSNNTDDKPDDWFTWKNMTYLKEEAFLGIISSYWGGGFVADLGYSGDNAANVVQQLKSWNWLDAHTRALFIEFAAFYPTNNMFMVSQLLIEFMSSGGTVVSPNLLSFCLDPYAGSKAAPLMIAQVLCLLFLLYFIYRECRKLFQEKKRYFLSFWNWIELLVIALMLTSLVMFIYRLNVKNSIVAYYTANPNTYTNFSSPLFWGQVYSWTLYIVLFIANVKFLRLLRFNRRISVFMETLRYGWHYMVAFCCTFFLVFMAFCSCAFLLFGTAILDFMSFLNTTESLLVVMLNVFNFNDFKSFNKFFGPLFFIFYTIVLNFILVNMFLSVVNDSFAVVRAQSVEQLNQYELVSFIWIKFKKLLGFTSANVESTTGPMYAEAQDIAERDLEDFHDRINEMYMRLEDYFREEKIDEQMKNDWRYKTISENTSIVRRPVVMSE